MTTATDATPTSGSSALSLFELRRHLIKRASTLAVRARTLRGRGDIVGAGKAAQEAARLRAVARQMADPPHRGTR